MSDLLKKSSYNYRLPESLIAQYPARKRDNCRLLHLDKTHGDLSHELFSGMVNYFKPGDVLVLNTSKVIPARLSGRKTSGGAIEVLLLRELEEGRWECLVKPGSRIKKGTNLFFSESLKGTVSEHLNGGVRIVEFQYENDFWQLLEKAGEMPLPPYIKRKATDEDSSAYQTVYATERGSAAAPTAGLHFTNEILESLKKKGVLIANVVLHIGLDTFRPLQVENILEHKMHSEFCTVPRETADMINLAKREKRRVIAVGTTSVRTLESFAKRRGKNSIRQADFSNDEQIFDSPKESKTTNDSLSEVIDTGSLWSQLFIYPGFEFKIVDGLLTNFHLPQSTLLMMIAAFAGYENIMNAYQEAVAKQYRFFSYGDAMLIL